MTGLIGFLTSLKAFLMLRLIAKVLVHKISAYLRNINLLERNTLCAQSCSYCLSANEVLFNRWSVTN